MKNKILIFVLSLFIASCSEEVKFNNPGFQTLKQGTMWNATNLRAILASDGSVTIIGSKDFETVTLRTDKITPHTADFGVNGIFYAEYDNRAVGFTGNYSTGFVGGNGQIIITDYSEGMVTGNFKFNAVNTDLGLVEPDKINFRNGTFYKIPVTSAQ